MIYIGADHGGYELKEKVKKYLEEKGRQFVDVGAHEVDPEDDYPDYAFAVAEKVRDGGPEDFGVLISVNRIGTTVAANKIKGVRAAAGYSEDAVKSGRSDIDANVLCLSGEKQTTDEVIHLIDTFLNTPFSFDERHVRRLSKIQRREQEE